MKKYSRLARLGLALLPFLALFGCGDGNMGLDDSKVQSIRSAAQKLYPNDSDAAEKWIAVQMESEKLFRALASEDKDIAGILEKAEAEFPEDSAKKLERARKMLNDYRTFSSLRQSVHISDIEFDTVKELSLKNSNGDYAKAFSYASLILDSIKKVKSMNFKLPREDVEKLMSEYAKNFVDDPISAAAKLEADTYARQRFISREVPPEYEGLKKYIESCRSDFTEQLNMLDGFVVHENSVLPESFYDGYASEKQWENRLETTDGTCALVAGNSVYFIDCSGVEIPALYFVNGPRKLFLTELDAVAENADSIIIHKGEERAECRMVGIVKGLPLAVLEAAGEIKGKPIGFLKDPKSSMRVNLCGVNAFGLLVSKPGNIRNIGKSSVSFNKADKTNLMKAGTFAIGVENPLVLAVKVKANQAQSLLKRPWSLASVRSAFSGAEKPFPDMEEALIGTAEKYEQKPAGERMAFVKAESALDIEFVSPKDFLKTLSDINEFSRRTDLLMRLLAQNKYFLYLDGETKTVWPELWEIAKGKEGVFVSGPKISAPAFARSYKGFVYMVGKLADNDLRKLRSKKLPGAFEARIEIETAMRRAIVNGINKVINDSFRKFGDYCPLDLEGNVSGGIYVPKGAPSEK